MALSAKAGSFTTPTTTNATFGVTGVGFQPKAVLFFWNDLTSDSNTVNSTIQGLGMAATTTQRAAVVIADNYTGTGTQCRHDNSKCISFLVGNTGVTMEADFVSFDADGFTLNFSTVDGTAKVVNYYALGGADLSNAAVKQFTMPNATGNQATTGVGFQPDAAIFIMAYGDGVGSPRTLTTTIMWQSIGFATNSTHRGTSAIGVGSGTHYGDYQRTAKCIAVTADGTTGGVIAEADHVSMDADGFTLNWTTVSSQTSVPVFALCLKGGNYFVGNDTQKTSTGTKATTGVGFQPVGLLFTSVMRAAGTTTNDAGSIQLTVGAATSTTARGTMAYVDGATNSSAVLDRTKVLKMIVDGAPPTVNAAADLSSLDSDGFTLNWSTADATAREFIFMAFGSTVSGTALTGVSATGAVGSVSVIIDQFNPDYKLRYRQRRPAFFKPGNAR